jgi:Sec-independent protein secretion pathway component TatC
MGTQNKKQPTTPQKATSNEPARQTFREHLRELRGRILWFVGSFIVVAVIGFEFKDIIQGLITMQLGDLSLINLKAPDEIQSTLKISLYVAVLAALPLGVYHAYRFMEPVLDRGGAYGARLFVISSLLVAASIAYAFMLTIPLALGVMIYHGQDAMAHGVTTQSFLDFAVGNSLAVAILFQLPLIIVFSNSVQSFTKKKFAWLQRVVLPATVVVAWATTPFVSFNRGIAGILLIAVPAIVMFEAAMFWAKKHSKAAVIAPQPIAKKAPEPVTEHIESLHEEMQAEQHQERLGQPVNPASFVTKQTIAETEALDPFPDEMFDAMLQDTDDYSYEPAQQQALPPSLEVVFDEPPAFKSSVPSTKPIIAAPQPAQIVATPTPQPVARVVQSQPTPLTQSISPTPQLVARPAPVPQPAKVVVQSMPQKPAFHTPVNVAPAPTYSSTPRFSFGASRVALPQPIAQPQPTAKPLGYSRPVLDTLKPQQTTTPRMRDLNAPQETRPFQMRPEQPFGNTIEGLLPA